MHRNWRKATCRQNQRFVPLFYFHITTEVILLDATLNIMLTLSVCYCCAGNWRSWTQNAEKEFKFQGNTNAQLLQGTTSPQGWVEEGNCPPCLWLNFFFLFSLRWIAGCRYMLYLNHKISQFTAKEKIIGITIQLEKDYIYQIIILQVFAC